MTYRIQNIKIMALDKIMEKYYQLIISITFDDGWKSQFDYALPLLDQHGFTSGMQIQDVLVCADVFIEHHLGSLRIR